MTCIELVVCNTILVGVLLYVFQHIYLGVLGAMPFSPLSAQSGHS